MRKRRLLLAAGASLATVALAGALTVGTAAADPIPAPPGGGYPPIVGGGAQTTQEIFNTLANTRILDGGARIMQSWNAEGSSNITTRDPAITPGCTIPRSGGITLFINSPACMDFARMVTNDSAIRPPGFTCIPMATDALSYAISGGSTAPSDLSDAVLRRIYSCDPAITFPSNPNGFEPLLGVFGAGSRTLFLGRLGLVDAANYTTLNPCARDTDSSGSGCRLTTGGCSAARES